jgi:hypothetical protein
MIGITLAKQGVGRVRGVMEGSGPITLPIAFVPFKLDGRKLGSVNKVVLLRDAPKSISSVELEVTLKDSMLARGLAGCHLAANFEANHRPGGARIQADPFSSGVFSCLDRSDSVPKFQVFGRAVFQPGDVTVPLLLPDDIVGDLRKGEFGVHEDSIAAAAEARADSISDAVEAQADSISTVAQARAESIVERSGRLVDSLHREGMRRADSTRRAAPRIADPNPTR